LLVRIKVFNHAVANQYWLAGLLTTNASRNSGSGSQTVSDLRFLDRTSLTIGPVSAKGSIIESLGL
jgi:hypothetical protein